MGSRTFDYRGRLRLLILHAVEEGYTHGYSIMKYLENIIGHSPGAGAIYPHLKFLREAGFLEVVPKVTAGERMVKEYRITEEGRRYLEARRKELQETLGLIEGFRILRELGWDELVKRIKSLIKTLPSMSEEGREEVRSLLKGFIEGLDKVVKGG
ncbi:MAG: PadR family transcriptional regulator [Desulfurococcales archaeon]|nr:PadR family transcriptional regulator [Desulfurococcales archaeon]